jgi:hypothetical protein
MKILFLPLTAVSSIRLKTPILVPPSPSDDTPYAIDWLLYVDFIVCEEVSVSFLTAVICN